MLMRNFSLNKPDLFFVYWIITLLKDKLFYRSFNLK
jgi:hypothetical protein